MKFEIIGYFVDADGDKSNPAEVFVAVDDLEAGHKITYYCPIGQHSEGYRDYLDDCEPITKEEYIKATKGYYTPEDYLNDGGKRLDLETWKNIFRNIKDMTPDEYYDGVLDCVEVIWLDNVGKPSEWGLAYGEELFEDGFKSEQEAQERLDYLENICINS